jgi:hypothetical protein
MTARSFVCLCLIIYRIVFTINNIHEHIVFKYHTLVVFTFVHRCAWKLVCHQPSRHSFSFSRLSILANCIRRLQLIFSYSPKEKTRRDDQKH